MSSFPFLCPLLPTNVADTVSLTDHAVDGTAQTTYTFSSKSIGTAANGRLIVVGAGSINATANRTISSLTIGGTSAAQVKFQSTSGGGGFIDVGLYILRVDIGTTASVVVNWSATQSRCGIGVWAIYNALSATATATASSVANPLTASLSISANGVAIGYAQAFEATVPTFTWTNLTENFDETVGTQTGHTGASTSSATSQTPTITATPSSLTAGAMVLGSFR